MKTKQIAAFILSLVMCFFLIACGTTEEQTDRVDELVENETLVASQTDSTDTDIGNETQENEQTEMAEEKSDSEQQEVSGISEGQVFDLENGTVMLNSGYEMPILGIGTFRLSGSEAENSVYWALRDGYRLIDTARIYGNEADVGRGIQRAIEEGIVTREEIFVTTKMWTDDFDNGAEAINASLERLGLDYIDDGISGTTFEREGLQAMLAEVEKGNIGTIIVKDMSRLGRNYVQMGMLREQLRRANVRLIAVNEGVDTDSGFDDDFLPFRDVINEYYAKDISKKIKSTFKAKGESGKHVASSPPYGYLKDCEDKNKWIIDEEAAPIVRRIFRMTIEGYGPFQIAKQLTAEHIPIPACHQAQLGVGLWQNREIKNPYKWTDSTIAHMLQKHEYLGHTVNFKTRKHFKDKKSHYVDKDQWLIFEDTHKPIIDKETFDNVQRIRGQVRRYPDGWGEAHPLTGLMYCAGCGGKMYVHRINNGKRVPMYVCGNYAKQPVGTLCKSAHRIKAEHVMEIVAKTIKEVIQYASLDKERFAEEIQSHIEDRQTVDFSEQRKRIAVFEKRIGELEMLIAKIYEDNALGKLSDKRYTMLYNQYEGEQEQLQGELDGYKTEQAQYENDRRSATRFLKLIERYSNVEEMTTFMLNEFVEKIIVHERDRKGSMDTTQKIEIYFNFIGEYIPPTMAEKEPTPEELEEIRKKEARKDRLHQNYLKRKANGKQREYEERIKTKKKEQIESQKEQIRAEDREKGIYFHAGVPSIPRANVPLLSGKQEVM